MQFFKSQKTTNDEIEVAVKKATDIVVEKQQVDIHKAVEAVEQKSQVDIDKAVETAIVKTMTVLEKSTQSSYNLASDEARNKPEAKLTQIQLYESYQWTYKAVYAIASNIAGLPVKLTSLTDPTLEITEGLAYDIIQRPNPVYSWYDLIEGYISYAELVGDSFMEIGGEAGYPQLYTMRADWMEIVPGKEELVEKYNWKPDGITKAHFTPDEIIHFKYWHPRSELYGLSASQPVRATMIVDAYAQQYQKKFFEQGFGGTTYGHWTGKESLTPTEFARLDQAMKIDMTGVMNSHKVPLLENVELKSTGSNPKDTQIAEQRISNRNDVLSSFGVPLVVVQVTDDKSSTYNNVQEQTKAFWQYTQLPKIRKLEEVLNYCFFNKLGVSLKFDLSNVAALQKDIKIQAETAKAVVDGGILTPNEAREKYYDLEPLPGGDILKSASTPSPTNNALINNAIPTNPGIPDGTGPYGRGLGPGEGKGDGTGLEKALPSKKKNSKVTRYESLLED